jgi:hypothetical protein
VGTLTLADLINAPLNPANLSTPTVHNLPGIPLNTSCDFGMAPGSGTTEFSAYGGSGLKPSKFLKIS